VDADAKPHGPTGGGGADDDDEELDEEGAKLKRLLGREEEAEMAAELGGISDDEDSDSEFVDPDQEELHPFLLQQRNKAEQAQVQKAQAAARAAQQAAAAAAAAVVKTEPVAAGVKRPRETSPGAANVPVKAQKTEAKPEAATRPIEVALRAILRGGSKVTTKDVTKQLRKKGLLNTDADKDELKSTIGRVAKIMKEGNASYVVLK
jgi:type II secretory pathway pseudopilin PulG